MRRGDSGLNEGRSNIHSGTDLLPVTRHTIIQRSNFHFTLHIVRNVIIIINNTLTLVYITVRDGNDILILIHLYRLVSNFT